MQRIALKVSLLVLAAQPALAESTIKIVSQGVSVNDLQSYDLGDGATAQTFETRIVATGTGGDVAGLAWSGERYGLGEITASSYADTMLCVFRTSDTDSYSNPASFNDAGWDWTVLGGIGKFAGATGSGHTTAGWGDTKFGDRLTWTDEGTITLE